MRRAAGALLVWLAPLSAAAAQRPDCGWRDPSPHTVRFADLQGLRLQYLDWGGHGEVLLFLPGLGQSAHIFDGLAPHFRPTHRVLGLTLRGQGKSSRPDSGYSTAVLVEDIRRFLDTQGVRRVTLVGHSMAGNALTEFTRRFPDRVTRLIYLEAAYDFTRMPSPERDPVQLEPPTADDLQSVAAGMRWFERVFGFSSPAIEADTRDINLQPDGSLTMQSAPPHITAQLWQGMISYAPRYDSVRAPILAIYAVSNSHPLLRPEAGAGERERATRFWQEEFLPYQKHSLGQLMESSGPVQVVVLRDTQHLCFIARRDEVEVVRAMRAFLARR